MDNTIDLDNIEDLEDSNKFDDLIEMFGIQDDDLIIVNNDGSYVIVPMNIAEILMSNKDFVDKVDVGFDNINDFSVFVKNTLENNK